MTRKTAFLPPFLILLILSVPFPCQAGDEGEEGPAATETVSAPTAKPETYGRVELSMVGFEARGVPRGSANSFGLNFKGGVRLTEILSLEGGVNWIVIPDVPIPIPLHWMLQDDGFYMNLGAGLRFNLVRYHENRVVPWFSVWRVGHLSLSDFSVGGAGTSYGVGVEGRTDGGKKWQLSMIFHRFTGDLEIYEGDYSLEYRDTEIRAVELAIALSMK